MRGFGEGFRTSHTHTQVSIQEHHANEGLITCAEYLLRAEIRFGTDYMRRLWLSFNVSVQT